MKPKITMAANGLIIGEEEFTRLKSKEQMCCLYQNQVMQFKRFDELEKIIKGYRFHQKVQYLIMGLLAAGGIYLLQLHVGN